MSVPSAQSTPIFPIIRIKLKFFNIEVLGLIDTGAVVSILSFNIFEKLPLTHPRIQKVITKQRNFKSASGDKIESKDFFQISFTFGDARLWHYFHIVERVNEKCILGLDFLTTYQASIDLQQNQLQLIHPQNRKTITINWDNYPINSLTIDEPKFALNHLTDELKVILSELLSKNDTLFASKMTELRTASTVKHKIVTEGQPVCLSRRRTPETLKVIIRQQIEEMLTHHVIRESCSPWAAPVGMVPSKSGEMRFCIDYSQLN